MIARRHHAAARHANAAADLAPRWRVAVRVAVPGDEAQYLALAVGGDRQSGPATIGEGGHNCLMPATPAKVAESASARRRFSFSTRVVRLRPSIRAAAATVFALL